MTLPMPWSDARSDLRPFWRYYGGKFRAAPMYPSPRHATIVEPFAGAAGYSTRYADRLVILVERYPVIAEMWRWLIEAPPSEALRIPPVDHVDDLPAWVPAGARSLVGFWMNTGATAPRRRLSSGLNALRETGRTVGWCDAVRERTARQMARIRHWQVIEGDYTDAPDIEATWFVDPPYNNAAGSHYVHSEVDFDALGAWCRERRGQVIACENEGASWLPFEALATVKAGPRSSGSAEAVWHRTERNRTENQTRSSRPVKTAPDSSTILEAGDRARTDDIQLGNVTAKGKS